MQIYHITSETEFQRALKTNLYSPQSLKKEGLIHASTKKQIISIAKRKYKRQLDLSVLIIDTDKVKPKIVFEKATSGESYPHIYGPLNLDAISDIQELKDLVGLSEEKINVITTSKYNLYNDEESLNEAESKKFLEDISKYDLILQSYQYSKPYKKLLQQGQNLNNIALLTDDREMGGGGLQTIIDYIHQSALIQDLHPPILLFLREATKDYIIKLTFEKTVSTLIKLLKIKRKDLAKNVGIETIRVMYKKYMIDFSFPPDAEAIDFEKGCKQIPLVINKFRRTLYKGPRFYWSIKKNEWLRIQNPELG